MTDKIILDGREVKVGDRMWSMVHGWCEIIGIRPNDKYPIKTTAETFKQSGSFFAGSPRVLFWDEVKIDPPPPPKQKVVRYQWLMQDSSGSYWMTNGLYTEEEVRTKDWGVGVLIIRPIEETAREDWE